MARSKFNMATLVKVADPAVAQATLAAEKNPLYCHALLLKRVIEVGQATCAELHAWLEQHKAELMPAAGVATWDKYSAACHMSYFVNRCRGAVTAELGGVAVPQGPTKAKKKDEAPAVAAPAEEPAEEAEVSEEEALLTAATE